MRKIFFRILNLALLVTLFASCDKSEGVVDPIDQNVNSLKFGPPPSPYPKSTVKDTFPTYYGKPSKTYTTVILGTQEWIMGYWENDCIDNEPTKEVGVYKSPNYDTNAQYYQWAGVLKDTEQSTWDNYVFDKPGFHIPTLKDLQTLHQFLGDFGKIYDVLGLDHYTDHRVGPPFNKFLSSGSNGGFWVNDDNSPNTQPGCGNVANVSRDRIGISRTNIESLAVRVIIVRNL